MKEKVLAYLGKEADYKIGDLVVRVKVVDYKNTFGRERYQITPIAGEGVQWVENLKFSTNDNNN